MIRFKLTEKLPLTIQIDGVDYKFPRFLRKDWKAWEAEEMAKREAEVRERIGDPEQWARIKLMFPATPLTKRELRERVYTIEGTGRVFRTCAEKAGVPADVIKRLIDDGEWDETELENLAVMLASIISDADVARHMQTDNGADGEKRTEGRDDPLTRARPALQI